MLEQSWNKIFSKILIHSIRISLCIEFILVPTFVFYELIRTYTQFFRFSLIFYTKLFSKSIFSPIIKIPPFLYCFLHQSPKYCHLNITQIQSVQTQYILKILMGAFKSMRKKRSLWYLQEIAEVYFVHFNCCTFWRW